MPTAQDVKRALMRVRSAMPRERQLGVGQRDIRLGLDRISRVVQKEQDWVGVHVGGTNGKGSICAMLAGLFKLAGLSHGTFTSPAMPERHNGLTINGMYINPRMYDLEIEHVQNRYQRFTNGHVFSRGEDPGHITPFEIDTAVAFRIFNKMAVKYGIVEVGMGGATDATNAMSQKGVTIISKIGLDHQEYLGNTIEEIAKVKAGIMRPDVPCIVDDSNTNSVIRILREHARSIGTQVTLAWKAMPFLDAVDTTRFKLEQYQKQNLCCAVLAFQKLLPNLEIDVNALLATSPYPLGRMESVNVSGLTGGTRRKPILVDGAHNMLGVEVLADYVNNRLRESDQPVTWVMGFSASKSKPFAALIKTLIQPQDNVAFVEYAPGPNDPAPVPVELGRDNINAIVENDSQVYDVELAEEPALAPALKWACETAKEGPVVMTGSLYLIRELYRLDGVVGKMMKTKRPGAAQLGHYTNLARERELTPEEDREFKQARRHWYLSPNRNAVFKNVKQGKKPTVRKVSEEERELQRTAAHHYLQVDNYVEQLKKQIGTEAEAYKETMSKLREYSPAKGNLIPRPMYKKRAPKGVSPTVEDGTASPKTDSSLLLGDFTRAESAARLPTDEATGKQESATVAGGSTCEEETGDRKPAFREDNSVESQMMGRRR